LQRGIEIGSPALSPQLPLEDVQLDPAALFSKRIVSFNGADKRSRPFDMLRTQVLQAMRSNGWRMVGITSPTSGCGKTVTAANLAFSIARQSDNSVVLVDSDLQRPRVADSLGLEPVEGGVVELLRNRTTLANVCLPVRVGDQGISVLPTASTRESSDLMASGAMRDLLHDLKSRYQIVAIDLPPMLTSDDVLAILPQVDCIILVVAIGQSKVSEVEQCKLHLRPNQLVRVVVNKSTEIQTGYYYG
jgi:Mrp family chromosome partitioning ATPase